MNESSPGCMTHEQLAALKTIIQDFPTSPSLLCDLEGCGPVAMLEEAFAAACGVKYALGLNSGTSAIHTALLATEVGPGDEVLVTPYSWPQSVSPVLFTGATPVFADIDPCSWHLDPVSVADRISSKTKAIIVAHLFGHMADMPILELISRAAGIRLITDAAHAMGASLYGKPAGAWGDVACFSLGRGELISCGEGGVLATNDLDLYERAVALTQHEDRYWRMAGVRHYGMALNYRLSPLLATLALADLKTMDRKLDHRKEVFSALSRGMEGAAGLYLQQGMEGEEPAAYGLPLTLADGVWREELCGRAQQKGIPLRPGPVGRALNLLMPRLKYPKVPFHWTHEKGACPVAEERCARKELWALGAMDMDGLDPSGANRMGQRLRQIASQIRRAA